MLEQCVLEANWKFTKAKQEQIVETNHGSVTFSQFDSNQQSGKAKKRVICCL